VFRRKSIQGYWLNDELHGFKSVYLGPYRAYLIGRQYKNSSYPPANYQLSSIEGLVEAMDNKSESKKILFSTKVPPVNSVVATPASVSEMVGEVETGAGRKNTPVAFVS